MEDDASRVESQKRLLVCLPVGVSKQASKQVSRYSTTWLQMPADQTYRAVSRAHRLGPVCAVEIVEVGFREAAWSWLGTVRGREQCPSMARTRLAAAKA